MTSRHTSKCLLVHQSTGAGKLFKCGCEFNTDCWVYFGRDFRQLKIWEKNLEKIAPRLHIGEQINKKAWELRQEYIDWVANIGHPHWKSLKWWISMIGDKNTLTSPLFLYICYIAYFDQLMEGKKRLHVIVVSENWNLLEALRLRAISMGIETSGSKRIYGNYLIEKLKPYIFFIGSWILFVKELIQDRESSKLSLREKKGDGTFNPNLRTAVIHTCIEEKCFGKDGSFHDRYFTELAQWLAQKDYQVVILPFVYQIKRNRYAAYTWMRNSRAHFLIPEDYLTYKDHLKNAVLIISMFTMYRGSRIYFREWDITPIITLLRWEQAKSRKNVKFLSYIPLLQRLSIKGWNIDLFIDKFENMPKEKPQIAALRRYFPKSTIIGYQHAAISPFMLKYTTTNKEYRTGLFPDQIVTNGPWFTQRLALDGVPYNRLRTGPSLRYAYLFSKINKQQCSNSIHHDLQKRVLVILNLDLNMSLELLDLVFKGLNDTNKILIKPHPMSNQKQLLRTLRCSNLPSHISWIEGSMEASLKQSDCVVATGSASLMESLAYGKPVVVVGRECGLDMNPLGWWMDEFPELQPVFSSYELGKAVDRLLNMDIEESTKKIAAIQNRVLSSYQKISEQSLLSFLP